MTSYFELRRSTSNQFFFNLRAINNETILTSEMYNTKASAENGISSVRVNAPSDGNYDRRKSVTDQWYFVLKAENGEIIGRGETYSSKSAMEAGILSVKASAPGATVRDST